MRFSIKILVTFLLASLVTGPLVTSVSGASPLQQQGLDWHAQSGKSGAVDEKAVATLVRSSWGISFQITATNLKPGNAYTLWLAVLNNPAACAARPCAPADAFANPATNTQVTQVGGGVASSNGTLGFGGVVPKGPLTDGWLAGRGLDDQLGAEIHFVINNHGPVIPGRENAMVSTYRDGCTDASLPAIFPATAKADGLPGPNTCQLYEIVIFQ